MFKNNLFIFSYPAQQNVCNRQNTSGHNKKCHDIHPRIPASFIIDVLKLQILFANCFSSEAWTHCSRHKIRIVLSKADDTQEPNCKFSSDLIFSKCRDTPPPVRAYLHLDEADHASVSDKSSWMRPAKLLQTTVWNKTVSCEFMKSTCSNHCLWQFRDEMLKQT